MSYEEFIRILGEIKLPEHFTVRGMHLTCVRNHLNWHPPVDFWAIQLGLYRKDSVTGVPGMGWSDPYPMMAEGLTEQRVVFKTFAALRDYCEHEAREAFEYEDVKVVGPHPNLHMLMRVCSGEFG